IPPTPAVPFAFSRTLVKAWLERRRGELGSRFKSRLLVTYLGLTAIPIGLLFFTANGLLQRSIDRWFSTPVREVVEKARMLEDMAEKRVTDEALADASALAAGRHGAGTDLEQFRRQHRLDSLEIYQGDRRVAVAAEPA